MEYGIMLKIITKNDVAFKSNLSNTPVTTQKYKNLFNQNTKPNTKNIVIILAIKLR
jgi:hypothetical protein